MNFKQKFSDAVLVHEKIGKTNPKRFNRIKLIEELGELVHALSKIETKDKKPKKNEQDIIDECGDVLMRLTMFIESNGYGKRVMKRVISKATKYSTYLKTGKYKKI